MAVSLLACGSGCTGVTPTLEPVTPWLRTFEGPDYGAFFEVLQTRDGNLLAVGASNWLHFPPYSGEALFVKLTMEGEVVWEKTWGGEGYEAAWSVSTAEAGGYLVFGETDSYGAGERDFFLLKIDEEGEQEWYRTYGGKEREWPFGMLLLADGDLLLYGFNQKPDDSDRNRYAARVSQEGDLLWEYNPASPEEDISLGAVETPEGDLVLTLNIEEDGGLVKLDRDGNLLWEKRFDLEGWQYASGLALTKEGGFLLAGFQARPGWMADTWLAGCTSTGELTWETTIANPAFDYANTLLPLRDGNYLIGGIGEGMPLYKISQDGTLLWEVKLGGEADYGTAGLLELEDGSIVGAGFLQITNGYAYDAILFLVDADGGLGE